MITNNMKRFLSLQKIIFTSIFFLFIFSYNLNASESKEEKFKPGEMIVEHIIDNHEWHIATIGSFHLTVPLPIILWDDGQIVTFMSSKFHHGHESYKGYALGAEGSDKGKIIKVDDNGEKIESATIYDFSITKNVLSLFFSVIIILIIFLTVSKRYKKNPISSPKGIQSMMEIIIVFVRDDVAKSSIGPKFEKYLPILLTIFFFILINNLLGIVPIFPGGANVTGNITICLVLALITFFVTTFSGNKNYWLHVFNTPGVPWWLKIPAPLMPIIEIIGIITKPFVLMLRLFANITAGHIIVLGFISLIIIFGEMSAAAAYGISVVSITLSVFISLLELLVAFLQAYVFTLLSAIYIGMAIEEHHHEQEHHTEVIS